MPPRNNTKRKPKPKASGPSAPANPVSSSTQAPATNANMAEVEQLMASLMGGPPQEKKISMEPFLRTFPSGRTYKYTPIFDGVCCTRELVSGEPRDGYSEANQIYHRSIFDEFTLANLFTNNSTAEEYKKTGIVPPGGVIPKTLPVPNIPQWQPPTDLDFDDSDGGEPFDVVKAMDEIMAPFGDMGVYDKHGQFVCSDCRQHFQDQNAYNMHMNSGAHKKQEQTCPSCKKMFVNATGLASHLESGACEGQKVDVKTFHRKVAARDHLRTITSPHQEVLPTYYKPQIDRWECPKCRHRCAEKKDLYTHLASKEHQYHAYHCPNEKCSKKFTRMAGLMAHLESESCKYMTYDDVQKNVNDLFFGHQDVNLKPVPISKVKSKATPKRKAKVKGATAK